MTPSQQFTLWLEKANIQHYGFPPDRLIAAKVEELIEQAKEPLIKIIRGREYE